MILDSVYSLINLKMKLSKYKLIIILLISAFLVRLFPVDFPVFTSDEARIAFRGYALSRFGTDELGRKFPLIFNSSEDYQLPVVSYLSSLGVLLFGKTDLGARIIFILLGAGIVFLIYKFAEIFLEDTSAIISSTILGIFSPGLIFFSKVPNEFIVLTFLTLFLFYILTREKVNKLFTLVLIIVLLLTSKYSFFILAPFVIYTVLAFNKNLPTKEKKAIFILSISSCALAFIYFLFIPQGSRSLVENNLPIFQDITIKNGIEKLRSQGLIIGWPPLLDKLLFSKLHLLIAGVLHWFSNLQLSALFGQIDNTGRWGFMNMGFFTKIAIIPFFWGLLYLLKENINKLKRLIIFTILLTFPLVFMYPIAKQELILPSVPFLVLIAGVGFSKLNSFFKLTVLLLIIFEIFINLTFVTSHIKNANVVRPQWVRDLVVDSYKFSLIENSGLSDDLTSDIAPFLLWYTDAPLSKKFSDESYPYKMHQTEISNIKIIGFENTFYKCGQDRPTGIIVSKRDLQKVPRDMRLLLTKSYKDSLGNTIGFLLPSAICIH